MQDKLIILILILASNSLFGQADQRSILELFHDEEKIKITDFDCQVIVEGEFRNLVIDSEDFFIFPIEGMYHKKCALIITLDDTQFQLSGLNISDLIDRYIEIRLNPKASSDCFYISYYHGCTVNPAKINENCPEGHDISVFDIPLISEELYNEADSLSKTIGIPLELFWFDGIKFTSKEDYIRWVRQKRK